MQYHPETISHKEQTVLPKQGGLKKSAYFTGKPVNKQSFVFYPSSKCWKQSQTQPADNRYYVQYLNLRTGAQWEQSREFASVNHADAFVGKINTGSIYYATYSFRPMLALFRCVFTVYHPDGKLTKHTRTVCNRRQADKIAEELAAQSEGSQCYWTKERAVSNDTQWQGEEERPDPNGKTYPITDPGSFWLGQEEEKAFVVCCFLPTSETWELEFANQDQAESYIEARPASPYHKYTIRLEGEPVPQPAPQTETAPLDTFSAEDAMREARA